ncbi:MAG TPA: hypothetical protein VMY35_08660 [Phycisphaerae bacterium]|nr:hypothetical protein [Phycisphaerae bacterium]
MGFTGFHRAGCCCGAPAACPCTGDDWTDLYDNTTQECNGLKRAYKISGYSDGALTACEDCDAATSPNAWDGTFPIWSVECFWRLGDEVTPAGKKINGKELYEVGIYLDSGQ